MSLQQLKQEMSVELDRILQYWLTHTIDNEYGGFRGRVDDENKVYPTADKGAVLNARILWTFSAAHKLKQQQPLLLAAKRAYEYFLTYFIDQRNGGVHWMLDYKGSPKDKRKQVYAQCFAIYALSEYYKVSKDERSKEQAIKIYDLLQKHSYDAKEGGYVDAFTEDWKQADNITVIGANDKKTMNTHLHVLEAFSNLYRIWPDKQLVKSQRDLLEIFYTKIVNQQSKHMELFFDEHWKKRGDVISYGHDIEASWLLVEAAELLHDEKLKSKFEKLSLEMVDATIESIDKDGGMWYEYEPSEKKWQKEKHWWPQSEAIVGFVNAWQISKNEKYATLAERSWQFTREHIIDKEKGEWYWGIKEDGGIMRRDKVGPWKCPYHNSRACMEIIQRIA